jgi:hypothetical protein
MAGVRLNREARFMQALLKGLAAIAPLILGLGPAPAADLPDLSKVDRTLRKEPPCTAKRPLYGLAVFGPKAQARVWMVLDRSKPEADAYDVLHIDRDADGDLTGRGERLTRDKDGRFHVGDFKDPATGVKHPDFHVRLTPGAEPTVMLGLRWRGQFRFGGGYPEDPEGGYLRFAARPADAPVVWVHGDAPFRFQRWYGGKLPVGGSEDFKVFLGQPGAGRSSFCAAQEHFLPPGEWVRATLLYRDGMGKEQRLVCELKERC